jgi:small-conductance mechanosensitive channel
MIQINPPAFNVTDANSVLAFVQSEQNVIGTASPIEILSLAAALVIAYLIGIFVAFYLKRRFSHKIKKDHLDFWIKLVRTLLIIAAIAVTVPPIFDASLVIVGFILIGSVAVFALAGQKVISNLISGLALMYERPYSSGDFIGVGTTEGTVVSLTLFATIVRTVNGVYIHIPHEQVYTSGISNYQANVARRYDYDLVIRYQDDSKEAVRIILSVLEGYQFALKTPEPEVFVSDLDENGVNIRARVWFPSAWANTQDDISVRIRILPEIKHALESAGIEIPFPQRTVWFGNDMHQKHADK